MSVFVTVGTTLFKDLIKTVQSKEILDELFNKGFKSLVIQYGKGDAPNVKHPSVNIESFAFANSLTQYFHDTSLVISHGGAGSILEALRAGKKLIVVINRSLMHDHQTELADELAKKGYLICTGNLIYSMSYPIIKLYIQDCDGLLNELQKGEFANLSPFT